ncbi:MAG: heme o synthase [Pseudomonadota bacterium]
MSSTEGTVQSARYARSGVRARAAEATVRDYVDLLKPRVMSLVVFTALVGLVLAPGELHPLIAASAILFIAIGAGASGALNMWYDADIDAVMSRTRGRPVPRGAVTGEEAFTFGITLSIGSVLALGLFTNWLAGGLLAFTIFFYAVIYTMWLKRRTPQNIVIGGAAGAFPPMIAWAAVTGTVSLESVVLFLIIFMWTPPHFWALALYKSGDYARAGVPMLPVVAGDRHTLRQILVYSLILVPLGLVPSLIGLAGWAYLTTALVTGAGWLWLTALLMRASPDERDSVAKQFFGYSILYLFALFSALLAEVLIGIAPFPSLIAHGVPA